MSLQTRLADLISAVGADIKALQAPPKFSVHRNGTNQGPFSASTPALIQFNTELFDTHGYYNTTTFRLQPTIAGYWSIQAVLSFAATNAVAGSWTEVWLYKNAAVYKGARSQFGASTGGAQGPTLATEVFLNGTTDFIDIRTSVSAALTLNGAAIQSHFSGHYIGS